MAELFHNGFYAMGTRCHCVFPGIDGNKAARVFHMLKNEVNRIENSLSRFLPDSDISILNKLAARKAVPVDSELYDILKTCQACAGITGGAFDITLRPLLEYWNGDLPNRGGRSQTQDPVALLEAVGMDHVILNDDEQTVSFDSDDVELDLGGFGKGYALAKIADLLRNFSVDNAFISFGESSVLTLGTHPAGDCWKVGINNYLDPGRSLHTFRIREGSVSTSGNFFVDDGGSLQRHRHVINPFTGHPVEAFATVSVFASSPVLAEILSTAFLVSPDEAVREIASELSQPEMEIVKVNYTNGTPEVRIL